MRTLFSFVVAVVFLSALSLNAFAQQQPGNGPGPGDQQMMGREITPENYTEVKARMLTMIEKRRTWLDKEKACVEAAKNADELKKCRPERPMGGMGGGMHQRGPGQQQGGGPGMGGQQ
jgi:hypothetical protein